MRPTDSSRLIGRSEIVSQSNRVSSSYSCGLYCPDSGPSYRVNTIPISLFTGESTNTNVQEVWANTYGWEFTYSGTMPGLYTSDSSIATSAMIQHGLMETDGYEAGDVTWFSGQYTYYRWFDAAYDCFLDQYQQEDSGPIEVQLPYRGSIQAQGPDIDYGNSRVDLGNNVFGNRNTVSRAWA